MRPLSQLVSAVTGAVTCDAPAGIECVGITADSRQAAPGLIFVAIKGAKHDGASFVPEAMAKGCVAVLGDAETAIAPGVPVIRASNPRRAYAEIAAALFDPQPEWIAAVTGTDGKTSTADFFRQLAALGGHRSASLGTLGVRGEGGVALAAEGRTTPFPDELHRTLQQLALGGYTHLGMEASSHGLDQYRLHGVRVRAAAFTYLGRDHLDYHHTPDAYFDAKAKLFSEVLRADGIAVLNQDDASFAALESICRARKIRMLGYGRHGHHLRLVSQKPTAQGQEIELDILGHAHRLSLPLVGDFQAMNMLAALGLALGCGGDVQALVSQLPALQGIPGRLERAAQLANGAAIYVDYAHTPLALAKVLTVLRAHTSSRLHVVFGCGGDRDTGKRPEMGRIACELADRVTVTDDNPRSEDAAAIRRAVLAACGHAKEVADRRAAIYGAVKSLGPGDILVVAGKGHEKTQTVAGIDHPFDDVAVAKEAAHETLDQ